jgi:hypothetical protein
MRAKRTGRSRGVLAGRSGPLACAAAIGVFAGVASTPARADEPVAASEPRLMSETAEVTSVVDAFDKDDPFDLNLTLGFSQQWKSANIRRETNLNQPGLSSGHFVAATENVATYSQSVSTLHIGADIGIYRDLALIVRLPLVLSDSRELGDLNGSINNPQRLLDPTGQPLFGLPFKSPTRSGFDYILFGLDWAIFNQQRDFTKPTWVIGVDGRIGIGTPLHACNANAAIQCIDPSTNDPTNPSVKAVGRDPGLSRGVDGIGFHTVFSRRYGYLEPYTGFKMLAEFAQAQSDMGQTNDFTGALVNHPPLVGTFLMGLEVIPWEHREQFQRLVGDLRVAGTYHSPGREYSELFDALGSSTAGTLRTGNPGAYHQGTTSTGTPGSVADPTASKAYFTGITDQQAFGSLAVSGSATWQAGQYIKFTAGLGLTWNQSHLITSADSCNPSFNGDINVAGPCTQPNGTNAKTATGIPNPNHRDVIDLPGHRFAADDTTIVDLWVSGVVMF